MVSLKKRISLKVKNLLNESTRRDRQTRRRLKTLVALININELTLLAYFQSMRCSGLSKKLLRTSIHYDLFVVTQKNLNNLWLVFIL
jgi:hypothetical protein